MQSSNEQLNHSEQSAQPSQLVLTANDDEKLLRYLELLIKIDKRMKGKGNEKIISTK